MQKPNESFVSEKDKVKRKHLKIEALDASTQDFNQSIYRTLTRQGAHNFWSSGPSDSPEANEHLIYSIANGTPDTQEETKGESAPTQVVDMGRHAVFYSFTIAIFDPSQI